MKKLLSQKGLPKRNIPIVSSSEVEKIKDDAEAALELLNDTRFKFLIDYFNQAKKEIVEIFVQNRIKKVQEIVKSDSLDKVFTTTRDEQYNELSGQYKFIEKTFEYITEVSKRPELLANSKEKGDIRLETSEKDND